MFILNVYIPDCAKQLTQDKMFCKLLQMSWLRKGDEEAGRHRRDDTDEPATNTRELTL